LPTPDARKVRSATDKPPLSSDLKESPGLARGFTPSVSKRREGATPLLSRDA